MSNDIRNRPVFLSEDDVAAVKKFAAAHGMSESEVIREAMAAFAGGDVPVRERVMVRKNIWIEPEDYIEFTRAARSSGIPIRQAISLALEARL